MNVNEILLRIIRARKQKRTEHGYGILTADKHLAGLLNTVGLDCCHRHVESTQASFSDLMEKAANTLVYSNDEMNLEIATSACDFKAKLKGIPKDFELPKNTLVVMRHVLTTSTKDRDGDILHSDGAELDPKMLLLFNHVHTLPIGKFLFTAGQNTKALKVASAIVDINELSHDSAVMVDNKMGRFSHGFRAVEFEEIKGEDGEASGFDIKRFEIMEESLVSVPANPEAETLDVLLSLVEGGKLTSPLMKQWGKNAMENRPAVGVGITFKQGEKLGDASRITTINCGTFAELKEAQDMGLIGGKKDEDKSGSRGGKGQKGEAAGSPKEADEKAKGEKEKTSDEEMTDDQIQYSQEWFGIFPGSYTPPDSKPYPNEHAARLRAPGDFEADSFKRSNNKFGEGIHAIFGKLEGKTSLTLQAIRFDKDKHSVAEAKAWLKKHDYKPIEFEAANEARYAQLLGCAQAAVAAFEKAEHTEFSKLWKGEWIEKSGRVLSKANESKIREASDDVAEAAKMEIPRPCKALLKSASINLDSVISSLGSEDQAEHNPTAKEAIAIVLSKATPAERDNLLGILKSMEEVDKRSKLLRQLRVLRR